MDLPGIAALFVRCPGQANAVEYAFEAVDVPGAVATQVNGISSDERIVGSFHTGQDHGFEKSGTTITVIDGPDAYATAVFGINALGHVVGSFNDSSGVHGFLQIGAAFELVDAGPTARGVNLGGQIVTDGFLVDGSTSSAITIPGAFSLSAFGINDSAQIVGRFFDASGHHGFILTGSLITAIDAPGATATDAQGINNLGQVVGDFDDGSTGRGFLLDSSGFTIIDVPGAESTAAFGINDSGHIVGMFVDRGVTHGFLAKPVICGDGVVAGSEACDDGNTVDGDCCSSTCQIEPSSTVCRRAASACVRIPAESITDSGRSRSAIPACRSRRSEATLGTAYLADFV